MGILARVVEVGLVDDVFKRQRSEIKESVRAPPVIRTDDNHSFRIDFADFACGVILNGEIVVRHIQRLHRFVEEIVTSYNRIF